MGFCPPLWPRDRGALWGLAWSQGCILPQQRDRGRGLLSACGRLRVPAGSQGFLGLKCLQVEKERLRPPSPTQKRKPGFGSWSFLRSRRTRPLPTGSGRGRGPFKGHPRAAPTLGMEETGRTWKEEVSLAPQDRCSTVQLGKPTPRSPHLQADPDRQTGGNPAPGPRFSPPGPPERWERPVAPGSVRTGKAEPAGLVCLGGGGRQVDGRPPPRHIPTGSLEMDWGGGRQAGK